MSDSPAKKGDVVIEHLWQCRRPTRPRVSRDDLWWKPSREGAGTSKPTGPIEVMTIGAWVARLSSAARLINTES
jgi:hypothetical protein